MRLAHVEQTYTEIKEKTSGTTPSDQRIIETPEGFRINPTYLQQVISDNREALSILAENDGPIAAEQNETTRQ